MTTTLNHTYYYHKNRTAKTTRANTAIATNGAHCFTKA